MYVRKIASLLYEAGSEWYNDRAGMFAAALAYYTIFAITPMFIFLVSLVSVIFSREDARLWLFLNIGAFIGPQVTSAFMNILEDIQDVPTTLVAVLLGLLTFFFATTRIVAHLKYSFDTIWDIPQKPGGGVWGTVRGRFSTFLIVILIGFLLILFAAASTVLIAAGDYLDRLLPEFSFLIKFSNLLVTMILGTFLFAVMFKFLPDARIAWTDVWIGAGVTAFLFLIGKQFLGMYFGSEAVRSAYGAAGSLVVIILWIYYSMLIIFYGAEFTQVYARKYGTKIRRETKKHRERLQKLHGHASYQE